MGLGVLIQEICYASCRCPQHVVQFLNLFTVNRLKVGEKTGETNSLLLHLPDYSSDCGLGINRQFTERLAGG